MFGDISVQNTAVNIQTNLWHVEKEEGIYSRDDQFWIQDEGNGWHLTVHYHQHCNFCTGRTWWNEWWHPTFGMFHLQLPAVCSFTLIHWTDRHAHRWFETRIRRYRPPTWWQSSQWYGGTFHDRCSRSLSGNTFITLLPFSLSLYDESSSIIRIEKNLACHWIDVTFQLEQVQGTLPRTSTTSQIQRQRTAATSSSYSSEGFVGSTDNTCSTSMTASGGPVSKAALLSMSTSLDTMVIFLSNLSIHLSLSVSLLITIIIFQVLRQTLSSRPSLGVSRRSSRVLPHYIHSKRKRSNSVSSCMNKGFVLFIFFKMWQWIVTISLNFFQLLRKLEISSLITHLQEIAGSEFDGN